jgi:uncharacterized protein YwqG
MNIPAVPLVPQPESIEAKDAVGFKWAGHPIGNRHQIGGEPDWIQGDEKVFCSCNKRMSFYAQIDSLGDKYSLGDCGMVYVFVCFDCLESKSIVQCY